MKVVIPMAGYGSRLRPHTYSRPKPLINVAGEPMLKHLIDTVEPLNADEYIFIVGYLGDQLETFIREEYDFKATFVVQEELSGQSPAIYLAKEHLEGEVVILFSDTLFETDIDAIRTTNADGIAYVKEVEDPRRFGVVKMDETGNITQFVEKPDSMENKQAVIGLYYIRDAAALLDAIKSQLEQEAMTKGEYYIADAFQIMIDRGAKFTTQEVTVWLDTGKPDTVLETNRYLLDNGHDNSADVQGDTVTIIPPVNIHSSAKVDHAIIGPHTTISADCEISYSIIHNSIVDREAVVKNAILDESLIGQRARVTGRYQILNVGDTSSVDIG